MSQIQIQHLSFSYEGSYEEVFQDVSFTFDTDWKCALIGRNGRGKTTLLKLLAGKLEYRGKILSPVNFDYFPYPIPDESFTPIELFEQLVPDGMNWQLMREIKELNLEEEIVYRPLFTLSPGEKTKFLLAVLFLKEQHFLLIDEPTNHLDLDGRQTMAKYLRKKQGFLLVSHDRRFLDSCTDHTIALNKTSIEIVKGTFSTWWENKQQREQGEMEENKRLKKEISRLQDASRQAKGWSEKVEKTKTGTRIGGLRPDRGAIGHKAAKMMKRAQVTQAHMEREIQKKEALLKDLETTQPLKLFPLTHHKEELLHIEDLQLSYGSEPLFSPVTFSIRAGQKIAVRGKNGCGKSSLLQYVRKLAGCLPEWEHAPERVSGIADTPSGLVLSYIPQDTSFLKGTPQEFAQENQIDNTVFFMLLRKLGLSREHLAKPMEAFSAGQKKQILLARSLAQKAHLYLWDEPLNYMDIFSRIQLEELLKGTDFTILFIEHDQAFSDALCDQVIHLNR